MTAIIALSVAWPLVILALAFTWRYSRQTASLGRRLGEVAQDFGAPADSSSGPQVRTKASSAAKRWGQGPKAAALKLRMSEYVMFRVGSFIVPALFGLFLRGIPGALLLGLLGLILVAVYFRSKERRWVLKAEERLPEFLRGVANALRAGSSVSQAMEAISHDTPGPLGDEVRRVMRREALGFSLEDTLEELARRIPSWDLRLAVIAITIQREVGGSLADVIDHITETIVARQKLKSEVRIITTQGRYSGWVLTALPFGLGALLWFTGPSYFHPMFHSRLGWGLIAAALVSVGLGGFFISRLVRAPEM